MILIVIISLISSVLLTGLIRRYAIKKSLIDIPNERSSHSIPVPRGGGLSIVLISLLAIIVTGSLDWLEYEQYIALLGGGCLVALIGWLDDHKDISALIRAMVHLAAASWTVFWLGGLSSLDLGLMTVHLGFFGSLLAVIAIVWMINLYNFMDGTDGLATVQALTAGSFAAFIFLSAGATGIGSILLAMLGAAAGFLVWNWPPAKIFMGDVGSSYLGYLFAALAMLGEQSGVMPLLVWFILLALFFWDTTLTLIYRFRKGEKWYAAHCSHAYQRFVQLGNSHKKLALIFLVINITIFWPLAWFTMRYNSLLLPIVIAVGILSAGLWLAIRRKYNKYHSS